ncbi:MAG: transporter [Bacteroidetes bacterium]|nr:MAG: transporter [Bacteroidota bacterium]
MQNTLNQPITSAAKKDSVLSLLRYLLLGAGFGIVLTKAEVISWYRIQEMFLFHSFHMYGVIGSAIVTGLISLQIIKRFGVKSTDGEEITIQPKPFHKGQVIGGLIFGLGWAMTGACPGPMFALTGAGVTVMLAAIVSALAGTWVYSWLRPKLPH